MNKIDLLLIILLTMLVCDKVDQLNTQLNEATKYNNTTEAVGVQRMGANDSQGNK